jgi:hypothetical protein
MSNLAFAIATLKRRIKQLAEELVALKAERDRLLSDLEAAHREIDHLRYR